MELNRENITKALELHANAEKSCVDECPYGNMRRCGSAMAKDVLSLIKELTEENERLRKLATVKEVEKEIVRKETRADTARKMQERLHERFGDDSNRVFSNYNIHRYIDQIAKEMLEGIE